MKKESRDVNVNAALFAAVAQFRLKGAVARTRPYLSGVHIYPHPDPDTNGVIMEASDGIVAAIAHDESGHSNGDFICGYPSDNETRQNISALVNRASLRKNHQARVIFNNHSGIIQEGKIGYKYHMPDTDSSFPDYRRLIAGVIDTQNADPSDIISISGSELARFTRASHILGHKGYFQLAPSTSITEPATIQIGEQPFFGMIMTAKATRNETNIPEWVQKIYRR